MADPVILTTEMLTFTREYYRIPVAILANNVPIDPTTLTVEWNVVVTEGRPVDADWFAGDWETTVDDVGETVYLARAYVGDSTTDFTLALGTTYDVYMRVSDTPERPARLVGRIKGV